LRVSHRSRATAGSGGSGLTSGGRGRRYCSRAIWKVTSSWLPPVRSRSWPMGSRATRPAFTFCLRRSLATPAITLATARTTAICSGVSDEATSCRRSCCASASPTAMARRRLPWTPRMRWTTSRVRRPASARACASSSAVVAGGGGRWSYKFWVSPLPPEGPVTFVCEWPAFDIEETYRELEGRRFIDAAANAKPIF
jgi:hypothetical protein